MGKLQFDANYQVEQSVIVLCENDYNKLGDLNSVTDIAYKDNMNAANTLSFVVHKYYDNGKMCKLWDDIVNFKLVWLKDFNEYYKISVSINETDETVKNVVGTALCESELSSLILYNLEVNSDNDIKYHDYERTTFYNPENPSLSLLHRVLSKAPHYKIKYVSNSLSNEKRILSADGTTIYDFLVGDVSKEFDCLFKFESFDRSISVYDLLNYCPKCNKRTDSDICPSCANKSMIKGYGKDTNILISTKNIAQEITLDSNQDQVKNCFKIIAGDDIMSAAVKDVSPNGSEYITYFSESDYKNMPSNLVNKLKQYSLEVESKNSRYTQVLTDLYNAYDNLAYLTSTMMPDITHEVGTATEQIQKLTSSTLSPVALNDVSTASIYTVNNAVLGMAKCLINTTDFKIDIVDNSSSLTSQTWTGKFIVNSYIKDDDGNPKDTATSENITIIINDDKQSFIEQKVKRCIQKEGSDDLSDLFKIENDDDFKSTLELYCLKRLESFLSAYDTCLQVLNEANCGVASSPFYESLYLPYYNRHNYIEEEYNERARQIEAVNTNIYNLEWEKQSIQKGLNLQTYLGEDYLLYLTYLREDKYENSNYISDGLTNEEIIEHAKQLREKAEKELKKSAEMQYTVSGNLNNFLVLEDFKPIVNYFETGNYIRMEIDDVIYKMRLLSYELNFSEDNIQTLNVEFSDVINAKNNTLGIKDVLDQAKSIASNFPSVITQVNKNTENALVAPGWVENGLSLTNLKIVSTADNQNMVVDNHGMWLKMYDDITCTYSPRQLKAQNNGIYLTKDNWKSIEVGVGEFVYIDPVTKEEVQEYGIIAKKIIGKQILGEDFGIYNADNTMEFSNNGLIITTNGDDNKISNALTIQKQYTKATGTVIERQLYIDENGNITLAGAAKIKWENVNTPEITDIDGLDDYLEQLDGRIQTFSQENDPSVDWTTSTLKAEHIGDIWLDTKSSLTRRWTGSEWETITDSELSELAKSKAQIFTTTPKPPYYVGDLWVQGVNGDILNCTTTRTSGNYNVSDWAKSSKYTDDTALNDFLNGDYKKDLENISNQIDGKADTYYQSEQPYPEQSSDQIIDECENLLGDLWYDTINNHVYRYTKVYEYDESSGNYYYNYSWKEIDGVPQEVFDSIDGIASIYVTIPSNPNIGDLLIPNSDIISGSKTYYAKKVYKYNGTNWTEINYTDDTAWKAWTSDSGEFGQYKTQIQKQIDGKSNCTYGGSTPPSNPETGDLWFCTDSSGGYGANKAYMYNGSSWVESNGVPDSVWDIADGKSSIFVVKPNKSLSSVDSNFYHKNDIWILESDMTLNGKLYKKGSIMTSTSDSTSFVESHWIEKVRYTDDTKANSAYDLAKSANTLGKELQKCLGFTTEIADDHIISPFIGGGYLQISSDKGKVVIDPSLKLTQQTHIFAIYNTDNKVVMGVDINGNGVFEGDVTTKNIIATGGNISGFQIDENGIFNITEEVGCGMQKYGNGSAFWAGKGGIGNGGEFAEFKVWHDGSLFATKATITGNITATSGKVSDFNIIGNKLYAETGTDGNGSGLGLISNSSDANIAIWAGANVNNIINAPLKIFHNGRAECSNLHITGGSISIGKNNSSEINFEVDSNGNVISRGSADFQCDTVYANDFHSRGSMMIEKSLDVSGTLGVYGGINVGDGSDVYISGSLNVGGDKDRIVNTEHYGTVCLSAYETATPYFGDIGNGITDENGICYIYFDEIFLETTIPNTEYYVFLQSYADSFVYVYEQTEYYFVVKSAKPNIKFVWEAKRRQKGTDNKRLEKFYN